MSATLWMQGAALKESVFMGREYIGVQNRRQEK